MTDHIQKLKPEEIPDMFQAWQEEHGKLTGSNVATCIIHFATMAIEPHVLSSLVTRLIEISGVEFCCHCGAIPARAKNVNGTVFLLCSCCCENVLFQDLGPQEGYT